MEILENAYPECPILLQEIYIYLGNSVLILIKQTMLHKILFSWFLLKICFSWTLQKGRSQGKGLSLYESFDNNVMYIKMQYNDKYNYTKYYRMLYLQMKLNRSTMQFSPLILFELNSHKSRWNKCSSHPYCSFSLSIGLLHLSTLSQNCSFIH